jgi:hypothetical protein
MSIGALSYVAPIRRIRPPVAPDFALLEEATSLFEGGHAVESIHKTLAHLFPGTTIPDLSREPLTFVQGSSRVTLRIKDDVLVASVPLVRLPEGGRAVAALRYVLGTIATTGQLYQPRLRGDEIHLEYADALHRSHPAKILEVLRAMPTEADDRDDWLAGEFGATPLDRADIRPLSPEELDVASRFWRAHWVEVEELCKDSQRKRSLFFLNDVTAWAIWRARFVLPLSGFLGVRLAEAANTWNDSNEDPTKRESALAKFAREMRDVRPEDLARSLGHAEYALSPLAEGTPPVIGRYFDGSDYIAKVDSLRTSGKSYDAAISLAVAFTYLAARYAWPTEVEHALTGALEAAAGKPWREAAQSLYEAAKALGERFGSADPEAAEGGDEGEEDAEDGDEGEDEGDADGEEEAR